MHVTSGEISMGRRVTSASVNRRVRASLRAACAAFLVVLGSAACGSSGSGGTGSAPKPGPNLITAEEIGRVNAQNAYEAVAKLRPAMLRQRQVASANAQASGDVIVYVDNTRLGDVEQLRQISTPTIAVVRYFSASEAQTKWGSGHPGGVIEVLTKR